MWPFRRTKIQDPPVTVVSQDGLIATFARLGPRSVWWSWEFDGLKFSVDHVELPSGWLDASRSAAEVVRSLKSQVEPIVRTCLKGWGPPELAEYHVNLQVPLLPGEFALTATNDEAWGDFCVHFDIRDGKIVEQWAGD